MGDLSIIFELENSDAILLAREVAVKPTIIR
jgi:hypothetical protein